MVSSRRRSVGLHFVALLLGFLLSGPAAPAQAGLFSISPDKERSIGADASREIEAQAPIVTGPVADWVESVGERLVKVSNPEFKYSFRVIDSPEINAFALPGGYIYVYTGLRKVIKTDDELAAVLAHEITHAENHHYASQYGKASKRGLILGLGGALLGLPNLAQQVLGLVDFARTQQYSRKHEYESDRLGLDRMVRAGYDPQGMVTLLDRLSQENKDYSRLDKWFGSHPDGAKRVEEVRREMTRLQQNPALAQTPLVAAEAEREDEE